jgi:hypothetical protein
MAGILKNREMNQSMQQRILGIHQLVQWWIKTEGKGYRVPKEKGPEF